MALTAAQTAYLETLIGTMTPADQADVEVRLARLGGDGNEALAAAEVLETRIATALQQPLKFSVPGDYSEDRSANISELRDKLEEAQADAGVPSSAGILTAVLPCTTRWGR